MIPHAWKIYEIEKITSPLIKSPIWNLKVKRQKTQITPYFLYSGESFTELLEVARKYNVKVDLSLGATILNFDNNGHLIP